MSETHTTDVLIVGAGPVGLFAIFQCGMLGMRCHVVDALDAAGGQCTALYPEKPIYDIPGYPRIDAGVLVDELVAQAAPFEPVYHFGQQVVALDKQEDGGFLAQTSTGERIAARAVIVAAGAGAFGPNRPPLNDLEAYEATGAVRYFVTRRADFAGKRVVVAGGGDSAVDWAVSLSEVAAHVAIVHRRDKFRAAPEMVARLRALAEAGKVEMVVPFQLSRLEGGDDGTLDTVIVKDLAGEERRLAADVLLPFYGLAMTLGPIAEWGLALERNHVLIDQATAETNVPGIFAVGDIATYPHKLKLILTGFAEAASAAHAIHPLVHPGEALHFEYSTTKGVPGAA
ncbi:MAG: NAD(P)/FAD-dependent oxidoreductase [Alphaproteobacteria bacterium]|nr:NAD(P)/FAD-dependent oxidoreductase [Alphaproteobacteria bacterium]MDX5369158.1 NAD(P)/FAD-dependent oxidoreductase [Alphaproteobacteria bacterium]MDX5463854.1 NAD(P)/FAD-dependent oxidoreductase [Alphaproteobacteria bacterium]